MTTETNHPDDKSGKNDRRPKQHHQEGKLPPADMQTLMKTMTASNNTKSHKKD